MENVTAVVPGRIINQVLSCLIHNMVGKAAKERLS